MKKPLLLACLLALLAFCFTACSCDSEEVEEKTFTVKFETYVDKKVNEQKVPSGGLVGRPGVKMERPGYNFEGWYNGEQKWDFEKSKVGKDITLTAKWERYLSFAAVSEIEDNYVKSLFSGDSLDGIIVTGCDYYTANVVIPESYNGKKVVGIYWAFANRSALRSVVIPKGVLYISANSFNNCPMLKSVVIPASVSKIDSGAFSACTALENIYCMAESKPSGWHDNFNKTSAQVTFGYTEDK